MFSGGAPSSLEELWMMNNKQASDEGAEALARALERGAMPKLEKVVADYGAFSAAGKAAIKKARADVSV